ncbi:MAG TPA: alpha/beta fold hydrolase [Myxococcota bacterium]
MKLRLWDHARRGPVVLFVHGYLDTGRSFDAVADDLQEMRCLALDMRGHGQSERIGAGGSYHLLDHMKDLAVVVDTLAKKGEPIEALVAHSMGGNVAFLLAGAMPQLVKRLLLIDSCGPPPEDASETPHRLEELLKSVLADKRPFSTVQSVDDAADKITAQNPGLSREGAMRMVKHVMVECADGKLAFPFDERLRGPSPVRWPEAMWLAMSARMTMPVLLLRASNGYVAEGEPTTTRLAAMRQATMRTVSGGHHLHVERARDVAAAVRDVLGAITP